MSPGARGHAVRCRVGAPPARSITGGARRRRCSASGIDPIKGEGGRKARCSNDKLSTEAGQVQVDGGDRCPDRLR